MKNTKILEYESWILILEYEYSWILEYEYSWILEYEFLNSWI